MAEKSRLYWVDFAKGIGILLVVFGHVWRGLHTSAVSLPNKLFDPVDRWIYSFHMPLFFFITGLFLVSGMRKPAKDFLGDKLATIAYPYVLWSFIHGAMEIGARSITHKDAGMTWRELFAHILYKPQGSQFWFLYVLLMCIVAFWGLWKIGLRTSSILAIAIALFIVKRTIGFGVPFGALYQFGDDFIFVAIGAFGAERVKQAMATNSKWIFPCVAGGGIVLLTCASATAWPLQHAIIFLAIALTGIAMTLAFSAMPGARRLNLIAYLGVLSLPIYLAHTVAAALVRMILIRAHVLNLPVHILLEVAVGIAAPVALYVTAKRFNIPGVFRWGTGQKKPSIPPQTSLPTSLAAAQ